MEKDIRDMCAKSRERELKICDTKKNIELHKSCISIVIDDYYYCLEHGFHKPIRTYIYPS